MKSKPHRVNILGVEIDKLNFEQSLFKARELIEAQGRHYIVTPNPEIVIAATRDEAFKEILNKADLAIPDGIGIVWLSKIFGENIPERITGVDLLERLIKLASNHDYTVFLLGGKSGVAEKAAVVLKALYPNLKIIGTFEGDAGSQGDREVHKKLKGIQIDILAVAYGPGKQERWIARNLPLLNVKLAIGVGGAFDLISGNKKRAPILLQKLGLEWVFRLIQEPGRLKRQLSIPIFVYLFVIEKLKNRGR